MYKLVFVGDNKHVYPSAPMDNFCSTFFVTVFTTYNALSSFVTTYINLAASSNTKPAGDNLCGHFAPSLRESFKTSLLFSTAYFNIQLSFPPEAYKNFSSLLKAKPYHDFGISRDCNTFSFFGSINCRLCTLCPLL